MENKKRHFKIEIKKLVCLPYLLEFVPTYHEWMQDPELLQMTGSEKLTLEQELKNHIGWLTSPTVYTFILLEKQSDQNVLLEGMPEVARGCRMVGDVNLYFHSYFEPDEAEIGIMIANKEDRRKGFGREAVEMIMNFGNCFYGKMTFIAKIDTWNTASQKLFEQFGFVKYDESKQFNEWHFKKTFEKRITEDEFKSLYKTTEIAVKI